MTAKSGMVVFKRTLKSILVDNGCPTFKEASELLEIKPSTFSDHVRSLYEDRDYGSFFVRKLSDALGISREEIRDRLEEPSINLPLDDETYFRSGKLKVHSEADYQKEVEARLSSLSEGDEYYYITSDQPWEFAWEEFQRQVITVIQNGATINYVFPDPDENNESGFVENFSKFIGEANIFWTVLNKGYLNFCRIVQNKSSLDQEYIQNKLRCYTTTNPFLSSPLFNLSIFRLALEDEEIATQAYIELNVGREARLWLPLSKAQTEMVERALFSQDGLGRKIKLNGEYHVKSR